jgi:hypothetical protein
MYTDHMFQNKENKSVPGVFSGSSLVSGTANLLWKAFQAVNRTLPEGELPAPKWAPGKMLKSYERSAPTLGFPRVTDSLCPKCVPEVRNSIIRGERDISTMVHENPGEIKAHILEENGRILMRRNMAPSRMCFPPALTLQGESKDSFLAETFDVRKTPISIVMGTPPSNTVAEPC